MARNSSCFALIAPLRFFRIISTASWKSFKLIRKMQLYSNRQTDGQKIWNTPIISRQSRHTSVYHFYHFLDSTTYFLSQIKHQIEESKNSVMSRMKILGLYENLNFIWYRQTCCRMQFALNKKTYFFRVKKSYPFFFWLFWQLSAGCRHMKFDEPKIPNYLVLPGRPSYPGQQLVDMKQAQFQFQYLWVDLLILKVRSNISRDKTINVWLLTLDSGDQTNIFCNKWWSKAVSFIDLLGVIMNTNTYKDKWKISNKFIE